MPPWSIEINPGRLLGRPPAILEAPPLSSCGVAADLLSRPSVFCHLRGSPRKGLPYPRHVRGMGRLRVPCPPQSAMHSASASISAPGLACAAGGCSCRRSELPKAPKTAACPKKRTAASPKDACHACLHEAAVSLEAIASPPSGQLPHSRIRPTHVLERPMTSAQAVLLMPAIRPANSGAMSITAAGVPNIAGPIPAIAAVMRTTEAATPGGPKPRQSAHSEDVRADTMQNSFRTHVVPTPRRTSASASGPAGARSSTSKSCGSAENQPTLPPSKPSCWCRYVGTKAKKMPPAKPPRASLTSTAQTCPLRSRASQGVGRDFMAPAPAACAGARRVSSSAEMRGCPSASDQP
mmetsp:Transcript_72552/g.216506  ORF Transcript_72552/g.216506 Transcript_72552/m.216506 type:complete len:351 (-) Transcript_72552:630-1682(-)